MKTMTRAVALYDPSADHRPDRPVWRPGALEWAQSRVGEAQRSAARAIHRARNRPPKTKTARVLVVVPAHNEEAGIRATLRALLTQTRRPDRILVVCDNCTDKTEEIARSFGRDVTVIRTEGNLERKVGALTYAWREYGAYGYDYVLGVDADTRLTPGSLADLESELEHNPKAGGVMARYTFDEASGTTRIARALIRLQRIEFTSWTVDILRRNRRTYVLGGQATLFRVAALAEVADSQRRRSPWNPDAQVEDMELTWKLKELGWETYVSSTARAYAGPMLTVHALWAQRRKWDEGMARLLLQSGVNAATAYPWRMQLKMLMDLITRVLLVILLTVGLSTGTFLWNWVWATPTVIAVALNLRTARKIPDRKPIDMLFGIILIPVELYLWFRLAVWATSWFNIVAGIRRDGWARQYKAEKAMVVR